MATKKITDVDYASEITSNLAHIGIENGKLCKFTVRQLIDNLIKPEQHRVIFRGKNLGNSITTEQQEAISSGIFSDIFLGDYWEIGGIIWRIVDIDYWYNTGSTPCLTHHIVIMPDTTIYSGSMGNTADNGYMGSAFRLHTISNCRDIITAAFGNNLLTHREYLVNALTDGLPSGGQWCDSDIELPNEIMMYGTAIHSPANNGVTVATFQTVDKTQLALFNIVPKYIIADKAYWLRDAVNSSKYAMVSNSGYALHAVVNSKQFFRPVFAIGGELL